MLFARSFVGLTCACVRLPEQFRMFSKFNEDYISQRLKDSDFSYMT